MIKLKKNNGITLIALVITIIVLLILAGISIQGLTGSGIFEKAKQAIEKNKYAGALEKVQLAVTTSYDETGNINNEFLKDNLNAIEGKEGELVEGENDITVKVDGYLFLVSKSTGEITKKDIEIADGEVDSSRDKIMVDANEYNELKETVATQSTLIANQTEIIQNLDNRISSLENNSTSSLGQSWTLLKKINVTSLTTANNSYKWSSGENINISSYKFLAIGNYVDGWGLQNYSIIPKTEFLKYNSTTNMLYVRGTMGSAAVYINNGNIYFGRDDNYTNNLSNVVLYGIN